MVGHKTAEAFGSLGQEEGVEEILRRFLRTRRKWCVRMSLWLLTWPATRKESRPNMRSFQIVTVSQRKGTLGLDERETIPLLLVRYFELAYILPQGNSIGLDWIRLD